MKKAIIPALLLTFSLQFNVLAQTDVDTSENLEQLDQMDLEDIFKVPVKPEVTVASKSELTIKKSPGIISLVSEKEIENSGARDLLEVLNLIPGFVFNVDVQGGISTGVRGIWAEEGKVLVQVDGQEINDVLWPTIMLFNHIPVDHIKRIEILRGPGSAIYGGQAELSVINIITKSAADLSGIEAHAKLGMIPTDIPDFTRRNVSLSFGQKFGDFGVVAHGLIGRGNLSNRQYTDFYGISYDMTQNQQMNPAFLNIGLNYKDLSVRLIADLYRRTSRDLFALSAPPEFPSIPSVHDGYYAEIKYDYRPWENITITPRFNYKQQFPWNADDEPTRKLNENKDYVGNFFSKAVERYLGNLTVNADITENINLIGGGEFYYDRARALDPISADFGPDKKQSSIAYNNMAVFAQGLYKHDLFSVTLGSRFENHSAYGSSFVPRGAITGSLGDFHAKFLASKAFRAPGIQNIINYVPKYSGGTSIRPENTTVLELELGYDITENMALTANLFDINLESPIIYFLHEANNAYDNFPRTGSRGFEVEYRYKDKKWGYATLSYGFNMANDNKVDVYAVPGRNDLLLGFPAHKVTLNSSLKITDNFSVNPSASFFSSRFGYNELVKEEPKIKEFEPTLLLNLNLLYRDLFMNGLDVSLGAYNLLNQTYYYIQPYNGYHAPMPGASTELSLNVGYRFPTR